MSVVDEDRVEIRLSSSIEAHLDEHGQLLWRQTYPMKFRSEQAFLNAVVELAKMSGWLVHHDRMRQNVQGHEGFPDLVLAKDGYVIFAELKMPKGTIAPEQQRWLETLRRHASTFLWRPDDWERIVEVLTGRKPGRVL